MTKPSDERRQTARYLRAFVGYYRPHWRLFLLDMLCALLIAAVDLAFPAVSRIAMQELLPQKAFTAFFAIMGTMVVAYALRGIFQYIVGYWGHTLGVLMEVDMRHDLFTHLQKLPFQFYDQHRTGHLMSRVVSDLFEVVELAHHGPEDLFISLVTLIGSFILMLRIDWKLALILFTLVPLIVAFTIFRRRRMSAASKRVKERTAGINADIESSISGIRTSKAFNNEAYERQRFEKGNAQYRTAKREFYHQMGIFSGGMDFLTNLLHVAVIAFGGALIMQGDMDVIDLVTFTLYISSFLKPIRQLAGFVEQYTTGMAGFIRFQELMAVESPIKDSPHALTLNSVRGELKIEDVSFSYDGQNDVLRHINLHVLPGQTVALVGPSGGGKSTLCHLLPRFYEPQEGAISIDGHNIADITLASLRSNIGIVQQDVMMFADTIMENIRYGRTDATDEEVYEAARLAEIAGDIEAFPQGYQTYVGERGVMLSGGQKQRLSIARIFLKNPPILILDEATSALDTITEAHIQAAFDKLSRGRTTLVIAHRLSTVRHADRIVYIDGHGIREEGTHTELMALDGAYAALYRTQFAVQGVSEE